MNRREAQQARRTIETLHREIQRLGSRKEQLSQQMEKLGEELLAVTEELSTSRWAAEKLSILVGVPEPEVERTSDDWRSRFASLDAEQRAQYGYPDKEDGYRSPGYPAYYSPGEHGSAAPVVVARRERGLGEGNE